MPGSVIKAAPEQLRHRTAEEQETDRVVLRDLRRTADVLRESGSAKNFEDITEQDWPDGDLNSTAEDMEPNQETSESQLPSRRLVRKIPPSEVDEKHSDSQIEHVGQTPVDAPSQPTVQLETTPFLPVLEPVSKPTQLSETTEPRAKQPRIGERVYPSPLPMPIPSTPHSQNIAETVQQVDDFVRDPEDECKHYTSKYRKWLRKSLCENNGYGIYSYENECDELQHHNQEKLERRAQQQAAHHAQQVHQ